MQSHWATESPVPWRGSASGRVHCCSENYTRHFTLIFETTVVTVARLACRKEHTASPWKQSYMPLAPRLLMKTSCSPSKLSEHIFKNILLLFRSPCYFRFVTSGPLLSKHIKSFVALNFSRT